ncbi:hypothetical protein NLC29_00670, partial [Candidatus Aminicenantes bacterium AH-873-B07]|nr:hypothetical protein [Candidatus Aminicenantes bacterium AH-873-B07]
NYSLCAKILDLNLREVLIEAPYGFKVGSECNLKIEIGNNEINARGVIILSTVSSLTQEAVIYFTKIRLRKISKENLIALSKFLK